MNFSSTPNSTTTTTTTTNDNQHHITVSPQPANNKGPSDIDIS
jgi:hypothetical protein